MLLAREEDQRVTQGIDSPRAEGDQAATKAGEGKPQASHGADDLLAEAGDSQPERAA